MNKIFLFTGPWPFAGVYKVLIEQTDQYWIWKNGGYELSSVNGPFDRCAVNGSPIHHIPFAASRNYPTLKYLYFCFAEKALIEDLIEINVHDLILYSNFSIKTKRYFELLNG
jgi:hypothetical protein